MQKVKQILKENNILANRYEIRGNATIIDTNNGRFVVKKNNYNNELFNYLKSRNFNYYPEVIYDDGSYTISRYIDEVDMPSNQKYEDMINLVSLLHTKTTHFKEMNSDEYKKIYEDLNNNIEYLKGYYNDIMSIIEARVYMSPSEYLLARNVSKIYQALDFCKGKTESWYEKVKDIRKGRMAVIHNNLDIKHFIRNNDPYLISWDKAKTDMPIFDLYKLYLNHGLDVNFEELLFRYEKQYPLFESERELLFILMALPKKIEFINDEYKMCRDISHDIDLIYKTEDIISPYYIVNTNQNENE
jgi:hypothetical protein